MSKEDKTHWVMDYETLSNLFVAVFEDYKSNIKYVFTIHEKLNHLPELYKFLKGNVERKEKHISYNGLAFDAQITEYMLRNEAFIVSVQPKEVAKLLYAKAQRVIEISKRKEFQEYSEKDLSIGQIDLFKLNHWDNPAKMSGLKWIQYSTDWLNILEMPIHHSTEITTMKQINTVIQYCCNDVKSTKHIMELSSEQINLRATLTKKYKVPLLSASEPRISKELFLLFLNRKTNIPKFELRQLRTKRLQINVSDILLPYIKFKRPEFIRLHEAYKKLIIDPMKIKGAFKYGLEHKKVMTEYGLGGLHGSIKSGVYTETDEMIIMSSDVTSFYPNLAIRNQWAPAHLPKEEFCELYEWFFEERKKIPKSDPINYVYKIILNSTYGLSNEANSFLYDPQFTMQITINGQLLLSMLYEMLSEGIPGSLPLMQNTDGLEIMIPKEYKEKYLEICKEWEKLTMLELEHDQYSKMIIRDVNNYIAINVKGKSKCKGSFDFENIALHKNKSYLVIRKAVYDFFVKGISPTTSLANNQNIFDYCGGVKIKGGQWSFQQSHTEGTVVIKEDLQSTLRYYNKINGKKIVKINNNDGRQIQLEAGKWLQQEYNNAIKKKWDDYDIDYEYYLYYINKEIENVTPKPKQQYNLELDFNE